MGFLIDIIIDWFWVGLMLRLRQNHPGWFSAVIALLLALLVAVFVLALRWTR